MECRWKEKPLAEVVDLVIDHRGKTPKKLNGDWAETGYRVLSAKNIKTGHIVQTDAIRYVDRDLYQKWMPDEVRRGDVFVTSEAPFGQIYYWDSDERIVLGQRLFGLRLNRTACDPKYAYYWMCGALFQSELRGRATGTTVVGLRQPELLKCTIRLPSMATQKAIANMLGAIDDKIALNYRINDHLAEMAMMLFDSECPQTNEPNAVLSDVAEITMGQSPSGSSYNENGHGEVFYQGRGEFGSFFPRRHLFTTEPKRMAREGDILVSVRAPVGDLNIAAEDCCIGRGLAAIHSGSNQSFVHYLMRAQKRQLDTFNGDGTVFGSINGKALKELSVYLPSNDGIAHLQSLLEPIDAMIRRNDDEMQALEQLRDALLPRLMSGEIDISRIGLRQLNGHLFER